MNVVRLFRRCAFLCFGFGGCLIRAERGSVLRRNLRRKQIKLARGTLSPLTPTLAPRSTGERGGGLCGRLPFVEAVRQDQTTPAFKRRAKGGLVGNPFGA